MTIRWVLTDPAASETWQMPINPDSMTSPHAAKDLTTAYGVRRHLDRVRTFALKPRPKEWEWSGVIRSQEHYDAYVTWASKPGAVHVTDHLGRTWEVYIKSFEPEERLPTATTPWRFRYTVKTLVMGRVS